ncbi:G patch domain-containing protein 8 isoform X2 [Erpetoichthys calabaricus]|nr:G patch domain-containing protein 8 isoform X2 [Erpetoichthys calabaricus]XP_051774837.1 G patch domain-containing protein 8 isoform X2 [Erpetoichthys calabaricus]
MQGRTDPIPIILKYDVMGVGRMEMEMDYAEDCTEKRRVLEVEKEDTEELRQKYKDFAEKEKAIAKALEDMRANFYCELCDKQYQKHQEFDNHINSYDHAHKQRLKELKQREFARNVSSRSRRDEKKQEKALRRLHELAEQRKQTDSTPGSGPMFRALTVAADEENSEDGSSYTDGVTCLLGEKILAEDGHAPNCSPPSSETSSKPANAVAGSTPLSLNASLLPKVGVSFSFAKKAPIKLETTASVFKDLGEEVSVEEGQKDEGKVASDPTPVVNTSDSESPSASQLTPVGCEDEQQDAEGGALASTLSKLKMMMKKEEGYSQQEPQYYHYMPPAHCKVKPNFQFMLFMKASDQSGCPLVDETCELPKEMDEAGDGERKTETPKQPDVQADEACKESNDPEKPQQPPAQSKANNGKSKEVGSSSKAQPSPASQVSDKQPATKSEQADGPRRSLGPFFPVLSKDESTTLQWPSELLEFTSAQPSLSYSCNPLYFDFKLSRNKDGRAKQNAEKVAAAAEQPAAPNTDKEGQGPSEPSPVTKKDKATKAHKAKKKKKHKKSSKRPSRKERNGEKEKGAAAGTSETAASEKSKKKKKRKQKKSKSRASEERENSNQAAGEAETAEVSEGAKRKRPLQEESQKATGGEHSASPDRHSSAKRHRPDGAEATTSSALRKPSSSPARRSRSRQPSSEEDESEDGQHQRRKASSRPAHRRRHHSGAYDSERSRSRSSRRGGRRHGRRASSHSRSYSSSSEHSSDRSSPYSSHRGRSYSDSYSDYSERSRQRRWSKHSPTSDSDYERSHRGGRRSRRRRYSTSEESSRSRSNSRGRSSRRRRSSHHRSSCSSSRSPSWKRSRSSYSRSSGSRSRRSSSSTKGSSRGGHHHRDSSADRPEGRRRDFIRSKIYRSQSPQSSSRTPASKKKEEGSGTVGSGAADAEPSSLEERNSLTARLLLEKVQSRKGPDEGATTSTKAGIKLKNPPQGYFGPKLPPSLGNKAVLPLFGKLPAVKKPVLLRRPEETGPEKVEEVEAPEAAAIETVIVEPIREFPPPPPPLPPPQLEENGQAPEEEVPAEVPPAAPEAPACLFQPEPALLMPPFSCEASEAPDKPLPPELQAFPAYVEAEEPDAEDESSLAPLESQPITFTPEEMEKYSKLQQAAQQHIQQQLLAKQVKSFPAAAAAAAAAAANLAQAPALQPLHIQQPPAAASATSITTVQHAILQHHAAAAAAIGIHPHPHHPHPQQLAQVHHIPQHHLTPISLSPLGHSLIPAHPAAFLSSHPIHIIPASAFHHTPLALHHVPHTALYPTLFTPRPTAAAAAAALHLHPLLHPIFSGQDLQHPPNHGS